MEAEIAGNLRQATAWPWANHFVSDICEKCDASRCLWAANVGIIHDSTSEGGRRM